MLRTDRDPIPGGLPEHWNADEAMLDSIHLTKAGYDALARHCIDSLYADWLRNPLPAGTAHAALATE